MMNLLQGASDDQVALIGCLVVLVASAGLMYLSFFVGPAARQQKRNESADGIRKFPVSVDKSHDRAA